MRTGTYTDSGHYLRKAVWLILAALLFIPHCILNIGAQIDERLLTLGERMYKFAHPCLYSRKAENHDAGDT